MKKITGHQIVTALATLFTITVNILANALPLNGLNTGEISDRFLIYFVPAGYVFSIWGLIYLGLLAYTVFQALPAQANNTTLKKIAPYYWLGSLANAIWIFLWHYEVFSWTILLMFLILASLLVINRNLTQSKGLIKWLVKLPFSIYLGWISVATVANASQWLYFLNWNGWRIGADIWAVIMLAVASLLGILMAWFENDTPYGLVLIWAFIGITVSQAGTPSVVTAAWVGVGLIGLALLGSVIKFKKIY
jgi:hypothetical protein